MNSSRTNHVKIGQNIGDRYKNLLAVYTMIGFGIGIAIAIEIDDKVENIFFKRICDLRLR